MNDIQKRLLRWISGYILLILATLPLALMVWNAYLLDAVGSVLSIEQIHLFQYAILGFLLGCFVRAGKRGWHDFRQSLIIVSTVSLTDECIQGILPQRYFQWSDVGLNLLGNLMGMSSVALMCGIRSSWDRMKTKLN